MQKAKYFIFLLVLGLTGFTAAAQTTGAEQQRMLEMLRKKMAEEQQSKTPAKASPVQAQPAAPAAKPAAAAPEKSQPKAEPKVQAQPKAEPKPPAKAAMKPAAKAAVRNDLPPISPAHQQMLDILHRELGQESVGAQPRAAARPAEPKAQKPPAVTPKHKTVLAPSVAAKPEKGAEPAAVEPAVQTGPKTKQQKLADLNALYRADKLSPTEYHEQRAKILSEP